MDSNITAKQYDAALQRALDEHLVITLLESWGAHVANPAHEGYYTVRIGAYTLECNCPAGQHGNYCKHRALVHEALTADKLLAAYCPASVPTPATPSKGWLEMSPNERAQMLAGLLVQE